MVPGRLRSLFDLLTSVILIIAALAVIWRVIFAPTAPPAAGARQVPPAVEDVRSSNLSLKLGKAAQRGQRTAKLVIVEFSDYQCPFCGRHARGTFNEIDRRFVTTNTVQYVFKNLPLPSHRDAADAAQAAECAGEQGKYWEMHRSLFEKQSELSRGIWNEEAQALDLDPARYAECLAGTMMPKVEGDLADAKRLGVNTTPTFFVGRHDEGDSVRLLTRITGAQPIEVFETALSDLLDRMAE